MTKSYKEVSEACAKALYDQTLGTTSGLAWSLMGKDIQDGYRRMVVIVFEKLWEIMTPDEICKFFRT